MEQLIKAKFGPGQQVTHLLKDGSRGLVTAFMVRGLNHNYEVQWDLDVSSWHLEMELAPVKEREPMGYWPSR